MQAGRPFTSRLRSTARSFWASDLPRGRRALWRFALFIITLLALFFRYGEWPEKIWFYLDRSTRALAMLGPPVAFGYGRAPFGGAMYGFGVVGSCAVLWLLRKALQTLSPISAICWSFLVVVTWLVFGILAVTPSV